MGPGSIERHGKPAGQAFGRPALRAGKTLTGYWNPWRASGRFAGSTLEGYASAALLLGGKRRAHSSRAARAHGLLCATGHTTTPGPRLSCSAVKPRHHCGPYIVGRMAYGP